MTIYPGQIDNNTSLPVAIDLRTPVNSSSYNKLRDAILAIQNELGVKPSGTNGTVKNRLAVVELNIANIIAAGSFSPSGDLGGTNTDIKVIGLQGITISSSAPTLNQTLLYNGSVWAPADLPSGITIGGDLGGTTFSQIVIGLQGTPIDSTAPTTGQYLAYDGTNWIPTSIESDVNVGGDVSGSLDNQLVVGLQGRDVNNAAPSTNQVLGWGGSEWLPLSLTEDMLAPAYAITMSLASPFVTLVEVSNSIVQPAFTATYNSTAITAVLTDNNGNPSKNVISTPTSFFSNNTFVKNTYGQSVTFTLTSSNGLATKTATQTITWAQKVFWGTGTAGQTGETFIESLANSAIQTSRARTFSITAGSGQKIYYAYRTAFGAATFTVGGFAGGFTLVATNISITNAYGFTETYTLYESDNANLGTITIVVS